MTIIPRVFTTLYVSQMSLVAKSKVGKPGSGTRVRLWDESVKFPSGKESQSLVETDQDPPSKVFSSRKYFC